jgi:dynein light chain LC8-type
VRVRVDLQALEEKRSERDIANHLKQEFDKNFTPTWNCIVGKSFGSFITHETKKYIYFSIGHLSVLLWKCG